MPNLGLLLLSAMGHGDRIFNLTQNRGHSTRDSHSNHLLRSSVVILNTPVVVFFPASQLVSQCSPDDKTPPKKVGVPLPPTPCPSNSQPLALSF